jgi:hypothetical protein
MRYEKYKSRNTHHIYYINPVFLRSSGVLRMYIILKNMNVDINAYSISRVAVKAIIMRDTNRNNLFSKNAMRRSGILNAFPEKRPWKRIIRENKIGCVRISDSAGLVTGLNILETFTIYVS